MKKSRLYTIGLQEIPILKEFGKPVTCRTSIYDFHCIFWTFAYIFFRILKFTAKITITMLYTYIIWENLCQNQIVSGIPTLRICSWTPIEMNIVKINDKIYAIFQQWPIAQWISWKRVEQKLITDILFFFQKSA